MGLFDGTALQRPVICERCELDVKQCQCPPLSIQADFAVAPEKQKIRISVERRKRGKLVTLIRGLRGSELQRRELLTQLKDFCGAGGTQASEGIEIQGDHSQRLAAELRRRGYSVAGK